MARGQADLLLEGLVDLQQAAVAVAGDQQDVRALLEHRGEFLLRQAQGILGAFGLADVDHQSAHHRPMPMLDQADDVAHPERLAIGADHPVVEAVITPGGGLAVAVGLGPERVLGVQDAAPEARFEPIMQRVAEQVLGVGRDIAVGKVVGVRLPGDCRQAFDQAAVVILAAAQFLFQGDATGNFRAEPTVDTNDYCENRHQ
ncbi:hypothetical protein D3C76_929970 [compost metagenome]